MSTVLTEGSHPGEFIISEANTGSTGVSRSRETVNFGASNALGDKIPAGCVVGRHNGTGLYYVLDPANSGGAEVPVGICFGAVDISVNSEGVILTRDCEVNAEEIVWPVPLTAAQKLTAINQMKTLGILVRTAT